ncbi:MAG TPA: hypothetical protein VFE47_22430 [Tepidisphaeraceae bacterium]|jgi:hypothetical protein|nr:hypothetical protein [Tepidisphaeraceae bacterium]
MGAASTSSSTDGPAWRGSIASPLQFRTVLEGALYDARRFADAYPAIYIYGSVASLLEGLLRLTADLHRPSDEEKRMYESTLPLIRSQAGDANINLLQRVDAIWAYVLEWPVAFRAPGNTDAIEELAGDLPEIVALDELVLAIHRLKRDLKKNREELKDRIAAGSILARAMQEASQSAEGEMKETLDAIKSWVETGVVCAEHAAPPDAVMALPEYLAHYLPDFAERIVQVRRSFRGWRNRPPQSVQGTAISTFEQFVTAIHQTIAAGSALQKIAPDHAAIEKLCSTAEWLRSPVAGWVTDLILRNDRQTPIAQVLSESLDLSAWSPLPNVMKGSRILADMLVSWSAEAINFFRQTLYETVIDLHLLQIISASGDLDDVARCIEQLTYRTAEGKVPPPHERKEIRLAEAFARELAVYSSPELAGFLARLRGIDAFWRKWKPTVRKSAGEDEGDEGPKASATASYLSRHEAERAALMAVQQSDKAWSPPLPQDMDGAAEGYDPIADARGMTKEYFRHLLESDIRAIDVLPVKYPFSRALAMQLRAIRRATDRNKPPTADEQQIIGRGFAALGLIIGGTENSPDQRILNEAWQAHLHFQLLTPGQVGDEKKFAPNGMIADADEFKSALADLISDAACLVVLFPNSDTWVDAYRQMERLNQRVVFGRELDEAERAEIQRALENIPEPPGELFANVPDFAGGFVRRAQQVFNFSRGRRAATRAEFDELLAVVLAQTSEILSGRNWDEDQQPLAAIDRQLRAMRRWTAGGREPTAAERDATRAALAVVTKLRGLDRMAEWAGRVGELAVAFCDDLPAGDGANVVAAVDINSTAEFSRMLNECIRDCRSFSGHGLFHKPTGGEIAWAEMAMRLGKIRRMLDQNVIPTRRERSELHDAISAFDAAAASPCPAIHDFQIDIADRLRRIDAYYAWLVTAGPFAGKETGSIDAAGITCVSLGGEMRVAFVRTGGAEAGIYVSRAEKICTTEQAGQINLEVMRYLPSTRDLLRLVPCDGWAPAEIRWNAHSDWLAYLIRGDVPQIGWAQTREVGEKGRVGGSAFAWATKGSSLIVIDVAGRSIFRINAEDGQRKELMSLPDDMPGNIVPRILIAPGGDSLLYTCGRGDGSIDLCVLEFAGNKPVSRVRKNFPGATALFPCWPHDAGMGCLVERPTGTEIISLPWEDGDGQVIYRSDVSTASGVAPAWSANGKFMAFFNPQAGAEPQLAMLDCDTQELIPLMKPGSVAGRLSFGEECVCLDGGEQATILRPAVSFQRAAVERF